MLLLIGCVIGLVLGLTGAGGSVFAVPLLMLLTATSMQEASGIALGAVAAAALLGSLRNGRNGMILWTPALLLAATGALFAPLGKWLASLAPESLLMLGFNGLALFIALRMWLSAQRNPEQAKVVRASKLAAVAPSQALCPISPSGQLQLRLPCISGLLVGGALVGLLFSPFTHIGSYYFTPEIALLCGNLFTFLSNKRRVRRWAGAFS